MAQLHILQTTPNAQPNSLNAECSKVGHVVCRSSASTCNVQEVAAPEFTVLSIETPLPMKQKQNLTGNVSLHTEHGKLLNVELLVDPGLAASILPEHLYRQHFADLSLAVPNVHFVTYTKKTFQY